MTKIITLQPNHPELARLFKQEKVKSWGVDSGFFYIEIPDNEDVKL